MENKIKGHPPGFPLSAFHTAASSAAAATHHQHQHLVAAAAAAAAANASSSGLCRGFLDPKLTGGIPGDQFNSFTLGVEY